MTKREYMERFDDYAKRGTRELADLMVGADVNDEKLRRELSRLRRRFNDMHDLVRSYCKRERANGASVCTDEMVRDWHRICRMVGVKVTNGR